MLRRSVVLLAPIALFLGGGASALLFVGGEPATGEGRATVTQGRAVQAAADVAEMDGQEVVAMAPAARSHRSRVIKEILPASVRIQLSRDGNVMRVASGVILGFGQREDVGKVGYVITNAHVVETRDPVKFDVLVDHKGESRAFAARVVAQGDVPEMDLALLEVPGLVGTAAELADDADFELGDDVVAVGAPFGRGISISSGIVSQLQWDGEGAAQGFKTDAPIGYGASGGGIFRVPDGKLLAVIEGYRTAKVSVPVAEKSYSFDVPMPGETFASPAAKVRTFLRREGVAHLLADLFPAGSLETTQTAQR